MNRILFCYDLEKSTPKEYEKIEAMIHEFSKYPTKVLNTTWVFYTEKTSLEIIWYFESNVEYGKFVAINAPHELLHHSKNVHFEITDAVIKMGEYWKKVNN